MRILLVVHECNSPYNVFPYGLGYLAAAFARFGAEVEVFDQAITHRSDAELAAHLRANGPYAMVGLGFQAAYFRTVVKTCAAINAAKGSAKLVLGGSAPSASPAYMLARMQADFVLTGEGDESGQALLGMLAGDLGPGEVPGLAWRDGEAIRVNPVGPPPRDLDALPFPAWEKFDLASYAFPRRIPGVSGLPRVLGLLTSRGCPYKCKFCYRMTPGARLRSIGNCIAELTEAVRRYGIEHFGFHDDLFMVNKKRTLEFCEAIRAANLNITWLCNGRFNIADREQLRAMRQAGCIQVSYGLESGDQAILDEMDKRITVEQILEVSAITREEGLLVGVPAMFGLPGETRASLRKTVDLIIATTSWHDRRTLRPMQPYPGCQYFKDCVARGLLQGEEDFYSRYFSSESFTVNLTALADHEFNEALLEANTRLLEEHYRRALEADLAAYRKIYFEQDSAGFVPMR